MLKTMLTRAALALMLGGAVTALPAVAHAEMSAAEARSAGLIGERPDGTVGAVSPDGESIAAHINAERRSVYQKIAAESGQPLDQVMSVAGAKQIAKLRAGEYYFDGGWKRK